MTKLKIFYSNLLTNEYHDFLVTLFPTDKPKRDKKERTTWAPKPVSVETFFKCEW